MQAATVPTPNLYGMLERTEHHVGWLRLVNPTGKVSVIGMSVYTIIAERLFIVTTNGQRIQIYYIIAKVICPCSPKNHQPIPKWYSGLYRLPTLRGSGLYGVITTVGVGRLLVHGRWWSIGNEAAFKSFKIYIKRRWIPLHPST